MSISLHWVGCEVSLPEIGKVHVTKTENLGADTKVFFKILEDGKEGVAIVPYFSKIEPISKK